MEKERGNGQRECFYCSKPGHIAKNCRRRLEDEKGHGGPATSEKASVQRARVAAVEARSVNEQSSAYPSQQPVMGPWSQRQSPREIQFSTFRAQKPKAGAAGGGSTYQAAAPTSGGSSGQDPSTLGGLLDNDSDIRVFCFAVRELEDEAEEVPFVRFG